MSETLVWLMYFISSVLAFACVHYKRWPLTLSTLLPALLGTLIWYLAVELGKEENEPSWMNVELGLNFSFFVIFAAAGAAVAAFLRSRRQS